MSESESEIDVKMVTLPPMRVLCFHGFGSSPEGAAFSLLKAWLEETGAWESRRERRCFGYNNPDPHPGSPNYGYDVWVTVDGSVTAAGDARIIDFPGGLYAVTRVRAKPDGAGIYEAWQKLARWVENSQYQMDLGTRQWLEESLDPFAGDPTGFTLDLYEPIRE